jgi:hypothetical protein
MHCRTAFHRVPGGMGGAGWGAGWVARGPLLPPAPGGYVGLCKKVHSSRGMSTWQPKGVCGCQQGAAPTQGAGVWSCALLWLWWP